MPNTIGDTSANLVYTPVAPAGTQWTVGPGDVLVFRGDQRHSYRNPGRDAAVGYSVVLLARS